MIIAPLMTPIMAAAAAVTMGSTIRLGQALRLVALGIMGVIVLSMLLTFFIPDSIISFPTNSQITSRSITGIAGSDDRSRCWCCRGLRNRAAGNC